MNIKQTIDDFLRKQKETKQAKIEKINQEESKLDEDYPLLATYIGQEKAITLLSVLCSSSIKNKVPLEHILITGLPGLGKSRLAQAISNEVDGLYTKVLGSSLKSKYDITPIHAFLNIKHSRKILFIDEIHSVSRKISEELYDVIQDFTLNGSPIDKFTLIGATTYPGNIDEPLRHRFVVPVTLNPYSPEDLSDIISDRYPELNDEIRDFIAARSKGIIRIALKYTKMIVQVALGEETEPSIRHAEFVMACIGVKDNGLTDADISVLLTLRNTLRPLSKNSICAMANVDLSEYSNIIEPILLHMNMISVIPTGRVITTKGLTYLRSIGE